MKKLTFKMLPLIPMLALTACGYGLSEIYSGVPYTSTVFEENYYNIWDATLDYRSNKYAVNEVAGERFLTEQDDLVFTSYESNNFKECEPEWNTYTYNYDKVESDKPNYGPSVKLSGIDNSFKYGVTSKLFDGQLFCNGDYQNARVQVPQTDYENEIQGGFAMRFAKEMAAGAPYFMLNFKCAMVTKESSNLESYESSDITLNLGFYVKTSTGIKHIPLKYNIPNAPTNSGDNWDTRDQHYVCFGFKLSEKTGDGYLNLDRLVGFSFEYELNSCTVPIPDGETPQHAVMLYEVSFPHSSWN